ncbi:imidazole glycerol phosphate synthase subunit HisH [Methanospirillum stamsii]|uniref:Imidazole glycerol phosphate synthase subunit HisH n=1 Tax=Methanospirillum stamsii TaxID=1277351 RepID=A0A2V2MUW9_9EURY|nr:imidazole glycerol phosphate synthase subunit HisH [Methanospirillum stamsii]PWR70100.1 imidazole glycerol phosphate synthase subunit HisH [Methanospirillum stamsii]
MILIIDIGMGNIGSILNMIKYLNFTANISRNKEDILSAEKIILPGVGSFDNAMKRLHEYDLISALNEQVIHKRKPILGICLGIQLFARKSEEGKEKGLGWLDAETIRFKLDSEGSLKVPHMGWNTALPIDNPVLFKGMGLEPKFYFVHSYHLQCNDPTDILSVTHYGYDFPSSIKHDNIYGVQFHPEKSHKFGKKLFYNFLEMV